MLIIVGLSVGLILLFLGGDWLVKGASRLAQSLGISPLIVGLTVVALGTSTPELLVSVNAALSGLSEIAVSNVVGSNIANIGLILGLSGLIFPIQVHAKLLRREIPIMILVAVIMALMFRDGAVSRVDGIVLLIGLLSFIGFMIFTSMQDTTTTDAETQNHEPVKRPKEVARLLIGLVLLMIGAQLTVSNATELARNLGISELVIGVTLVAVGTSLPELVTSVLAALRQESDIAIGNVVGSNIFNVLGILGLTAVIQPVPVAPQTMNVDALVMVGFSLLVLPFVFDRKLNRLESVAFLSFYVLFTGYVVLSAI